MKDATVYLRHILDSISRVRRYVRGGKRVFTSDPMIQDAVIRNIEIIGEATKNLPRAFRSRHRQVPWSSIAGMRDKLIHAYFGVDLGIVWRVVRRDLPALNKQIKAILAAPRAAMK